MRKTLTIIASALALTASAQTPVYLDLSKPIEERVEDALSRMTLREKVGIVHAQSKFSSPGVARLGIPEVWCTDGPHGIRPDVLWDEWDQAGCTNDSCVAFPALSGLAATWSTEMAYLYGVSIGEEARYRNKTVLLGPGCNILRNPLNGRSFEYLGEDPYLSGQMVTQYILGVQAQGVAACVKHYALNSNELNRYTTNAIADERTLREIYLPAFEAAVKEGKSWSIMGGYNLFRGQHACHNDYLMNKILKDEWGFDGVVISDWGGTQSTEEAIFNSLDLEYGTWTDGLKMGLTNAYDNYYLANPYLKLIEEGKVGTKELDDKCRRVLRMIMRTSMNPFRPFGALNSEAHVAAARRIGEESIVLLKNAAVGPKNNQKTVLPIDLGTVKNVLVVGENAIKMMTVGGGSSSLKVQHEISPLQGIQTRLAGTGVKVAYERGYVGDTGGEYNGVKTGQDLSDSRSASQLIADAVAKAKEADVVIFIGGLNKADHQDAEGFDREQYGLPYGQDAVIEALAEANPRLVVVNISGNAVAMPWVNKVSAIVQDWYLGSEAGNSLASVLVGDVNPSGHLPMTWYASLDQCSVFAQHDAKGRRLKKQAAASAQTIDELKAVNPAQYPGIKVEGKDQWDITYEEGLFVGYRYIDQQNLKPLFPFGFGLSYTTFDIEDASFTVDGNGMPVVTASVKNTGNVAGAQVVQLYVRDVKSSVVRPVKELKGFSKVFLNPGESRKVEISLTERDLSYYDEASRSWVAEAGHFHLLVGFSSQDIRKSLDFEKK
ncbi:MAG: glycoside hydrolase family 3 C-terminal domain-containing protein [Bacteroidales bacterium]|nr:glycoside hydrolase family 3 C-terminal domain-containing protein [Candidatus Liminaster caballi]